jgi:inosose dehydratase
MNSMANIRIANAPCSWGTLEFEGMKGERIEYSQMLDELGETGYVGTELGDWGFMPTDPAALHRELESRGLNMIGAFVPVALKYPECLAAGIEDALRYARLLAAVAERGPNAWAPVIVLADNNGTEKVRTENAGRVKPAMGLTNAEWKIFAQGAEKVARTVKAETGLRTVFHHHCAGYIETPEEIDRLLDMTDPDLLGLVFDTGHYVYGTGTADGQRAVEGLRRYGSRIWHMHFKDCQPQVAAEARAQAWDYFGAVRHGVFCELGQGNVDFVGVTAELRARGFKNWIVVEQDVLPGMGVPKTSAQRNREYLRSIGL